MTRIATQTLPQLPQTDDIEVLNYARAVNKYLQELNQKTASITFNNSEVISVADTGSANTEFAVQHNLQRLPVHAYCTSTTVAGNLYNSTTTWTTHIVYLKFSGAHANIKVVLT